MSKEAHIEELRDMLDNLKHDAKWLYQYGNPSGSMKLFNQLAEDDQKILLCLALIEGDKDVQNVARYLMEMINPAFKSLEQLLTQIPTESKSFLFKRSRMAELTKIDHERISLQLRKTVEEIGSLSVEEAFWILIPEDPMENVVWIEAAGNKDESLSRIRMPNEVIYDPKKEEKYELIVFMRKALWILHIHNHPILPGYNISCEPSDNDWGFASQWKSIRKELASKMLFFVVQGNCVVEYSLPQGKTMTWELE